MKSDALIESKSLRESYVDRTEVLEKVKKLMLLPDDVNASMEQVADYYEVPKQTINSLIFDNREELHSDGLRTLTGEELNSFKELGLVGKNASAFTVIPRRAILRIGMLLRDSTIAQTVRTRLLDAEETLRHMTPLEMLAHLAQQAVEKEKADAERDKEVQRLRSGLDTLTDNLTAVPDQAKVVDLVHEYVRWTRFDHKETYNLVYGIMLDQHGIDVPRVMENERKRLNDQRIAETGKPYAEKTLKSRVSGITIMVRMGVLDKFHAILVGLLAKEKAGRHL
ncbi:hypothetical protein KIH86_03505 [Paenibacillus sp. HN-1]|nr:hypothetical protein [Paenibacillus sp. CGMCC 1.18879]MBY9077248.1 hypothetical protein [Paenibacillus sp. CGMCC 1.18879]MBY9083295.1 hypothetical protein [Paenibacillus sinensis]